MCIHKTVVKDGYIEEDEDDSFPASPDFQIDSDQFIDFLNERLILIEDFGG